MPSRLPVFGAKISWLPVFGAKISRLPVFGAKISRLTVWRTPPPPSSWPIYREKSVKIDPKTDIFTKSYGVFFLVRGIYFLCVKICLLGVF